MDVAVTLQIAAKGVQGQIEAGEKVLFCGPLFDDIGGEERETVKKITIDPKERLKDCGNGPGHMLPEGIGQGVNGGLDPIIGGLFSTGRTETGFAGVWGLDAFKALRTDERMVAEERGSADQHFKDIGDDAGTNQLGVRQPETPPVAVVEKDVSDFDLTTDEFHKGTIVNLNVDER